MHIFSPVTKEQIFNYEDTTGGRIIRTELLPCWLASSTSVRNLGYFGLQ
jgi:hypothetical protein